MHGGDIIAQALERQGVRFLFTLCGGHISPILVGAKQRGIRVVDTRHEATAVFAADAVARLTGRPGVAAVTAGPGVTNAITALKNVQLAQSPLVLIGGATATVLAGRGALQDIDQTALVAPHVKWFAQVRKVRDLAPAIERAFHVAQDGVPGPVFVQTPVDLLYDEATVREWYGVKSGGGRRGLAGFAEQSYLRWHLRRLFAGAARSSSAPIEQPVTPPVSPAAVARAAALLAAAERPVALVGSQATLAAGEVKALAGALGGLGLPVYLSGMARGLLGVDSPLQRRHRRKEALREADLVILAGVPVDFRLDYGRQIGRQAKLLAVNRSAFDLRKNRRPDLAVQADPALFLRALAAAAGPGEGRFAAWLETLAERDRGREAEIDAQAAAASGEGVHPLRLFRELDRLLDRDSVLVADGGDFVATAAYTLRPRGPLSWLDPGAFGTLGVGAGFALGAKLVRPESEVWLLWGDGSAGYGLAEIDSFARHGLGVIAVIGNDASWAQIARDQVTLLGDAVGTQLARTAYERVAEALGGRGLLLDKPGATAATLTAAKDHARQGMPVVVNVHLAASEFRKGSISI
jgi:acetolactate synthase-1/2/3 large subunit